MSLAPEEALRRRIARDPLPHFKPNRRDQSDPIYGCLAKALPANHLARDVEQVVAALELSSVEREYSSLGRNGFSPRSLLAVWIYASLKGVHHSTKLADAIITDIAFRYLAWGYSISASVLRKFRQRHGDFFERAIQHTVNLAEKNKLLDTSELAIDSMRLRAHASLAATRTLVRSKKRLAELEAASAELQSLTEEEQKRVAQKLEKHRAVVNRCQAENRTGFILTNDSAALMKFPYGALAPGHRVTVTAAGAKLRFVLSVLVDASGNDFGKLGVAVGQAQAALREAKVPQGQLLRFTADAGYTSEEDLLFALNAPAGVEILLEDGPLRGHRSEEGHKFFTRADFTIDADGKASCPAGRKMQGPMSDGPDRIRYNGVGCSACPLRDKCTDRKTRSLTVRPKLESARARVIALMSKPGARDNYRKRIATVEPVFSGLQDQMGFRRSSTRHNKALRAEILLNVLAYNISRLLKAKKLRYAWAFLGQERDGDLVVVLA
jgi:transposase